ncbi:MAG TPA: ABC transporter permease [Solirubrobacter sp.]|nr:ABC transporter permease [Solirubrobacter sp.]
MSAVASPIETQQPTLVGNDLRRFWSLTWTLAVTDWKLRFYGSVLGYVWTLARPFLFFGVIYFVFTEIVSVNKAINNYGVCILFSLVLFNFLGEAVGGCVASLVTRESLLRKMRFPRLAIPLSVVLTALFNLGMTLVAVLIFAIASGVYPNPHWLELPLIIGGLVVFSTGLGLLLAALFVRYRDVQPIWEVVSQMLFYASPILYVATTVPAKYADLYLANPIAVLMTETRHAVVDLSAPHPWQIASPAMMLLPLAISLCVLALGVWVFSREAPLIAENL